MTFAMYIPDGTPCLTWNSEYLIIFETCVWKNFCKILLPFLGIFSQKIGGNLRNSQCCYLWVKCVLHVMLRRQCCEFIDLLLQTWPTSVLERQSSALYEAIKKGISDADPDARLNSRRYCKPAPVASGQEGGGLSEQLFLLLSKSMLRFMCRALEQTFYGVWCHSALFTGFLQVRENWKMSGTLCCQGKSGKKIFFWKVRESDLRSCRLQITVIACISKY